jgi:hypothetical protein
LEKVRAEASRRKAEADRHQTECRRYKEVLQTLLTELDARSARMARADVEDLRALIMQSLRSSLTETRKASLKDTPVSDTAASLTAGGSPGLAMPGFADAASETIDKLRARIVQLERHQKRLEKENHSLRGRNLQSELELKHSASLQGEQLGGGNRSPRNSQGACSPWQTIRTLDAPMVVDLDRGGRADDDEVQAVQEDHLRRKSPPASAASKCGSLARSRRTSMESAKAMGFSPRCIAEAVALTGRNAGVHVLPLESIKSPTIAAVATAPGFGSRGTGGEAERPALAWLELDSNKQEMAWVQEH